MNNKNYLSLVLVGFFVLAGVFYFKNNHKVLLDNHSDNDITFVKVGDSTIKVDIANTEISQEKGLSDRNKLNENEGMLFVFNNSGKHFFWMKDMNFAIDMIWIGEDSRVLYIEKDARPESFPESFGPDKDSKYVLEVTSGFSEKSNLKIGDSVTFIK